MLEGATFQRTYKALRAHHRAPQSQGARRRDRGNETPVVTGCPNVPLSALLLKPLLGLNGPQIVEWACVVVAQDWQPEACQRGDPGRSLVDRVHWW